MQLGRDCRLLGILGHRHFHLFVRKAGCCTIVWEMKLRSAAQRLDVDVESFPESVAVVSILDICAMFFAKRSRSILSSFSLRFIAPGLCFNVFCLITLTWLLGSFISVSVSGKASASESRLVASFLDARRRLVAFWELFSIFETKLACLMVRLSFFVVRKASSKRPDLVDGGAPLPPTWVLATDCFFADLIGAFGKHQLRQFEGIFM